MRMNALGQLVEVVEPAAYGGGSLSVAGDVETSYDYDALGDLTSVRQGPSRQQRDFQYDSLGRLTAEYLPEKNRSLSDSGAYVGANSGHWSDVYAYDDHSNLTLRIDARGVQTHYNYASGTYPIDPLNRLQGLSYSFAAGSNSANISPSSAVSFEYMSSGDVTRPKQIAISQGASESWLYDSFGRVASRAVGYGGALQLSEGIQYDSLNRPTHVAQPGDNGTRTLDYSYDIGGMLKSLTVDGVAYASNMFYDLAGHTASAAIGPSGALQTTETSHFDPATGRLSSQVVQRGNELPLLLSLSYAYDPSGQLHESNDGNAQRTYRYDAVGRLQQVDGTDPQNKTWTEAYRFDPYGNRLSVTATGMPPDGIPSTAYDPKTNHAVGATYDEAGNQQQFQLDGPDLLAWYDQAGRMVKVTNRAGTKTLESFGYGPDGHKLFSQVGAETAYYFGDGNDVVATYKQSSGDTNWKWAKSAIFMGGRRLATILPGTVLYHHTDRIGTRLITNNKDNTTIYQETLPFGTLIVGNSPDPVNPIFTSYDRSSATGLDDAVNREFNPGQSFTQPDLMGMSAASPSAPQSLNLYAYAGNDPVNNTDPSGLEIRHQSYRDGPGDKCESIVCLQRGANYGGPPSAPAVEATGYFDTSDPAAVLDAAESASYVYKEWKQAGADQNDYPAGAISDLINLGVMTKDQVEEEAIRAGTPMDGRRGATLADNSDLGVILAARRLPDFYSLSFGTGVLLLGAQDSLTIDRYGTVYFGGGPTVGTPGMSLSLTANYLCTCQQPTDSQLNNFITGWSYSAAGGVVGGAKGSYTPGNGFAVGGGLFTPGAAGGPSYGGNLSEAVQSFMGILVKGISGLYGP